MWSVKRRLKRSLDARTDALAVVAAQAGTMAIDRMNAVTDLRQVELRVFSQWGEDGILWFLCNRLGIWKPTIFELGVGDFSECNGRFLAEARNASIFAVDADPRLAESQVVRRLGPRCGVFGHTAWVSTANIGHLQEMSANYIGQPDIVSIDLDGQDYWILEQMDLTGVSVVVCEYNAIFGPRSTVSVEHVEGFVRASEGFARLLYGASLQAFNFLLTGRGFRLVGTNSAGNNAFWVRETALEHFDDLDLRQLPWPNSFDYRVREVHDPSRKPSLISGTDALRALGDAVLVNVVTGNTVAIRDLDRA
jgi:hypothetical protein